MVREPHSPPLHLSDLLALIPAWNEGERIGAVIQSLPQGIRVLVVDDGSTDCTVETATSLGVQVIQHECNKGKGLALMTGFTWALEQNIPAVLTLDADGQHDPSEAFKFLEAYNQTGADLIIGFRDLEQIPFPRNLANQFSSWLLTKIMREHIYDNQSGYRLHSARLLRALEVRHTGFEFEVDVILQAIQQGFKLAWVKIRTIYSPEITSHFHPLRDSLRFFTVAWYAYRSTRLTKEK